jgi:hypothetical protein
MNKVLNRCFVKNAKHHEQPAEEKKNPTGDCHVRENYY